MGKFPTFGICDKVTVVATDSQTVSLRSPDRSRPNPDREITKIIMRGEITESRAKRRN